MALQRTVFSAAACSILASFAYGAPADQLTSPPQAAGYKLAFDDEFDTLDLSPDGSGMHRWYEGVWFEHELPPRSNISASSSTLSLSWRRGQDTFDTSIETLARDKSHFQAWRYGYFEARMKWDVAKGAWPAFWLIPVEDATGRSVRNGRRESGEIDVFEGYGDEPHTFYGTIHDWIDGKQAAYNKHHGFPLPDDVDFSQFHTYGVLWLPGSVTWYLDVRPLHSEKTYPVMDKETYFMVLSMQEAIGYKKGDTRGLGKDTLALNVDWVRVWQK